MSTFPRLHQSPNATDTAILIATSKNEPVSWAAITRGSAADAIRGHRARHYRLRRPSRTELSWLALLGALSAALAVVLYLTGTPAPVAVLPLLLLGLGGAGLGMPEPLPPTIAEQMGAIARQDEVLALCPVPIAETLTTTQHAALTVAADYEVVDETLELLIEDHNSSIDAEKGRRREVATEIVTGALAPQGRHAEHTVL